MDVRIWHPSESTSLPQRGLTGCVPIARGEWSSSAQAHVSALGADGAGVQRAWEARLHRTHRGGLRVRNHALPDRSRRSPLSRRPGRGAPLRRGAPGSAGALDVGVLWVSFAHDGGGCSHRRVQARDVLEVTQVENVQLLAGLGDEPQAATGSGDVLCAAAKTARATRSRKVTCRRSTAKSGRALSEDRRNADRTASAARPASSPATATNVNPFTVTLCPPRRCPGSLDQSPAPPARPRRTDARSLARRTPLRTPPTPDGTQTLPTSRRGASAPRPAGSARADNPHPGPARGVVPALVPRRSFSPIRSCRSRGQGGIPFCPPRGQERIGAAAIEVRAGSPDTLAGFVAAGAEGQSSCRGDGPVRRA